MREIKTAVITGANGFIGINLVRRLLKENIHIYAFVMEEEPLKEDLFNPLVTVVRCNLEAIDYNSVDRKLVDYRNESLTFFRKACSLADKNVYE